MVATIRWFSSVFLLGLVVGCSGEAAQRNTSGGGENASGDRDDTHVSDAGPGDASVAEACEGLARKHLQCYQNRFDQARCAAAADCFRLVFRDQAEQALLNCYAAWATTPDCDGEWCTQQIKGIEPTAEHAAHEQRCRAYVSACGGDGGDICNNGVLAVDGALLAALAPCFENGCGGLKDCVNDAASSYLVQCGGNVGGLW
jgi:hypothetical protein